MIIIAFIPFLMVARGAQLQTAGHQVILVSSGAMAAGREIPPALWDEPSGC
jgi:glutamate 5-kinase